MTKKIGNLNTKYNIDRNFVPVIDITTTTYDVDCTYSILFLFTFLMFQIRVEQGKEPTTLMKILKGKLIVTLV